MSVKKYLPHKATFFTILITAAFSAILVELYYEAVVCYQSQSAIGLMAGDYSVLLALRICIIFLIIATGGLVLRPYARSAFATAFKWRYIIGALYIIICVVFEISGSSLACWDLYLGETADYSTTLGISRPIRTDEWATFTPLAFSQEYTNYAPYSDIARASATDVTMVYAQPAYTIVTLFRPFLWGYLLLGSTKGLAFFWSARLVVLFLVSFEFGRLITKDNKILSLLTAILIAFAPIVQWWFAINGLVEMLIFGQLICIFFSRFIGAVTPRSRLLSLVGIAYCILAYLFVLYPAWQIPLFYVFLGVILWTVLSLRKTKQIRLRRDIPLLICAIALSLAVAVLLVAQSWETVAQVIDSSYPGARVETGGGGLQMLGRWTNGFLAPIVSPSVLNACELASMWGLFPLGGILALVVLVKKRDSLLIICLVISIFLLLFICFGFPEIIARITLLSFSTSWRCMLGLELLNVFMLLRALALLTERSVSSTSDSYDLRIGKGANRVLLIGCVIMIALTIVALIWGLNGYQGWTNHLLVASFVLVILALIVFSVQTKRVVWIATFLGTIALVSGLMVNPVQLGAAPMTKNPVLTEVKAISESDAEGEWIVEGESYPLNNALLSYGIPTINSTQIYPNNERWATLDQDGAYEEIYNRYAHISINLVNEDTSFNLVSTDNFEIRLSLQDLDKLGVNYLLTRNDFSDITEQSGFLQEIYHSGEWTVYMIL